METSWLLLELACFFDLNKVYTYLPTYLYKGNGDLWEKGQFNTSDL